MQGIGIQLPATPVSRQEGEEISHQLAAPKGPSYRMEWDVASWSCHLPVGDGALGWKRTSFPHGPVCNSVYM